MKQINLLSVVIAGVIITGSLISCNQKKEKDMQKDAIVLADIDTTVSPKTDFYQYATGGWQENNPLPEEESRFGSFDQLGKQTSHKVKELIEALAKNEHEKGSIEWMIGTFYAVGMDTITDWESAVCFICLAVLILTTAICKLLICSREALVCQTGIIISATMPAAGKSARSMSGT
jgi:hypothetical protein